ncbi:MAG: 3-methyl-2-oxobutanoate hydroxymethyltransferase [Gammaproteobacteria bacterium]|nr:3-methyl-2-oxobutanoate hydroxymethyltransferase [Gammaproteobacteria bacterium]
MNSEPQRKPVSVNTLKRFKDKQEKFACLTAYDYSSAHVVSARGVDVILVGDSLGMVVQGHDSSLPVTIDDVAYHTRCVNRGNRGAFVIADLPFMSYYSELKSLENAAVLMREGAQMVKLEGGAWLADSTRLLVRHGIPVCAHMGLTPQSINHLGGYRVQGRDPQKAQEMIDEAVILQDAGADLILLECVPLALGRKITERLVVPVIGIGAGPHTDGQIMVLHDMLGLFPGRPAKFVKNFLQGQSNGVQGAVADYVEAVKAGAFPAPEHCYE